jgi:hypothetical protein
VAPVAQYDEVPGMEYSIAERTYGSHVRPFDESPGNGDTGAQDGWLRPDEERSVALDTLDDSAHCRDTVRGGPQILCIGRVFLGDERTVAVDHGARNDDGLTDVDRGSRQTGQQRLRI